MLKKTLSFIVSLAILLSSVLPVYADNAMSYEQGVLYLRSQMVNRSKDISLTLNEEINDEIAKQLFNDAIANTGDPHQGDYLAFSTYWPWYYPKTKINGNTVSYSINYSSTFEEEQQVDIEVSQIIKQLKLNCKTDYEKVCIINDWIVESITFESVSADNLGSAYSAFIQKVAPCRGFAVAFMRLCTEVGIEARIVYQKNKQHEWNLVKLNENWYHVDCQGSNYRDNPRLLFLKGSKSWSEIPHTLHDDFDAFSIAEEDYVPNPNDAVEHSYDSGKIIRKPTCGKYGLKKYTCTQCGKSYNKKISATKKHNFAAKAIKPPTADSTGVISYTCNGCGYSFKREAPMLKGTYITHTSSRCGAIGIRWAKQNTATGYQIRYSQRKNMDCSHSIIINRRTAVTKIFSGLKSNEKYYVQIRVYQQIGNKKYYSHWSKTKAVTTK